VLSGCATYRAGVALPDTDTPVAALAARSPGRLVWISLNDPSEDEVLRLATTLHVGQDLAQLLAAPRPRPGLRHHDDDLVSLTAGAARYDHDRDLVEIGSVVAVVGDGLLVTITRHAPAPLKDLRRHMEIAGTDLAEGAWHVVHRIVERVVTGYGHVLEALRSDVEALERLAFSDAGAPEGITQRIYLLKREAIDFRQGVAALVDPLDDLADGMPRTAVGQQEWATLRDHLNRIVDRSLTVSELLGGILTAYQTDVALQQNEDMRKISAWVAIAAIPTMLAGIYGMNFEHMPELEQPWAYPALLVFMAGCCAALYLQFRKRNWL
jgi:magnesium transporter